MKTGNIRRIVNVISILVLATAFLLNAALCEQTAWDCPECGRTGNTGNYCGSCAHPAPWMETVDNEDSESTQKDISAFRKIDNIVTFGHYEQDNNLDNGPEEIEWIVLDYDEKENKSLLLSRYGLDAKPYNTDYIFVTWENCTLRKWLNNDFLKRAFSEEEQAAIPITVVDNSSPHESRFTVGIAGGVHTQDQIFLLSCTEANQYFEIENNQKNVIARVAPTAFAIAQGAKSSAGNQTIDGKQAGYWWLRSCSNYQTCAIYISFVGSFRYADANITRGVVRPAMWVNLESNIF